MRYVSVLGLGAALSLSAQHALADAPKVVTDIAPVHGLVAAVMGDLGSPDLIVDPGQSPHMNAMRPSQAAALQQADLVFWVGEGLTQWLHEPLETLAEGATHIALSEVGGVTTHDLRDDARFAHDDHGDEDHGDDHKDHDDHAHDDHGHDDHKDEDGHDDHAGHAGHDHGDFDPHLWLDPQNASVWVTVIANALSDADPANAAAYAANAEAMRGEIAAAEAAASARLEPLHETPFVVFHDGFQYFEKRFDLNGAGALSIGDATPPGPARLAEIQDLIADEGVSCVFSEPQYNDKIINAVASAVDVTIVKLDPLGQDIPLGAGHYPALIEAMTQSFEVCLQ